jgi:D-glycero-D-manno-heptose 1,7-bisphosphate phosphatase
MFRDDGISHQPDPLRNAIGENLAQAAGQRPFVMLDRDGTLIRECHYLSDPDQVEIIAGVVEALGRLSGMGLGLIIVTNQSGIGRGFFTEERLEEIHRRICVGLEREGIHLDGIYYCPHRPDEGCGCRKPSPGLVKKASEELRFKPQESFMVGDNVCDVELGQRVGATTILVRTGHGIRAQENGGIRPDFIVDDLLAAVPLIENRVRIPRGKK